jgi:SP family sugar:H+ symporter-like MFS transporter
MLHYRCLGLFLLTGNQDRTLEEIDEMFEARLPARQFRKYICIGRDIASDDEKAIRRQWGCIERDGIVRHEVVGVGKMIRDGSA